MHIKNLFKSTKNEERIKQLEKDLHEAQEFNSHLNKHVSNLNTAYLKKFETLEKRTTNTTDEFDIFNEQLKFISKLQDTLKREQGKYEYKTETLFKAHAHLISTLSKKIIQNTLEIKAQNKVIDLFTDSINENNQGVIDLKEKLEGSNNFFSSKVNGILEDIQKITGKELTTASQIKLHEDRIGKQELMHVEIFKKQNELFQKGMQSLVNQSAQSTEYAMKLSKQKSDEMIVSSEKGMKDFHDTLINFIAMAQVTLRLNFDETPKEKDYSASYERIDVTLNDKPLRLVKKQLTFYEIIVFSGLDHLALEYKITFKNGADPDKEKGFVLPGDTLAIKTGTKIEAAIARGFRQ